MKKSEQELANELDAFLKGALQGQRNPPTGDLPPETVEMAAHLIKLSQAAEPDPAFAAGLEKQMAAKLKRIQGERPLSFAEKASVFLRSMTMKRSIVALGGLAALFLFVFVAWRMFSGGTEPEPEQVAIVTPGATSDIGEAAATPAAPGALPTLPAISMAGGMGGGGMGMGGGAAVASDNRPMPVDEMILPMASVFSGTTFALNGTLPAEPTLATVLEYPSPTIDLAQAQQLAARFGFSGPLYTQSYPVFETEPAPEGVEPLPEAPPTYFAFDGTRQFTVYQGGAS
jgi:hypothetical protein